MKILALETSCDESAAAIVENGRRILSSVVASQIPIHRPYSGVVPELASRAHVETINSVVTAALKKAQLSLSKDIDVIGVTIGPGLVGSLLVGRLTAETLGWVHQIPVVGVNHIEGHLISPILFNQTIKPPFLGLVVSGGHTELIVAQKWGDYKLLGRTRDDAAGEAFDKVAKMLDLGYPGGPVIDRLAAKGRADRCPFPHPWLPGTWDFSFSGLKTAVLYKLREKKKWSLQDKRNLCAGFQKAVATVLVGKAMRAAEVFKMKTIVVGGGVAANRELRNLLTQESKKRGINLVLAPVELCTDNAAMIASAAYFSIHKKKPSLTPTLRLQPQWSLPVLTGQAARSFSPSVEN